MGTRPETPRSTASPSAPTGAGTSSGRVPATSPSHRPDAAVIPDSAAMSLGQQCQAFAIALLCAYGLEKSQSIVAPMIGHSVGHLVEFLLVVGCVHAG